MQQEPKIVVVKYYVLWSNKLSRIAKQPVEIPSDVEININESHVSFKGPKGEISMDLHSTVKINKEDKVINVETVEFEHGSEITVFDLEVSENQIKAYHIR
jgi:ribosomal protein L6P/L9E